MEQKIKDTPSHTQAQRDAARAASTSTAQDVAQRSAQQIAAARKPAAQRRSHAVTDDPPPENCAACGYHLPTQECRRHAPHPGHDEPQILARWNFTRDNDRCGAGSSTKQWVPCWDCTHWHLPDGKPLNSNYKQGLPAEWWEQARVCTVHPPGTTIGEGMPTFWRVTSNYPTNGEVGGCGDGISITAILEAAEKKRAASEDMSGLRAHP